MPLKSKPRPVAGARLQERVTATDSHNPTAASHKTSACARLSGQGNRQHPKLDHLQRDR